jgi:hypothetical protein
MCVSEGEGSHSPVVDPDSGAQAQDDIADAMTDGLAPDATDRLGRRCLPEMMRAMAMEGMPRQSASLLADNAGSTTLATPMTVAHPPSLTPLLFAAGIGWMYYRRIRRQFGRQPYQHKRALLRTGLLVAVLCGMLVAAVALPKVGLAIVGGILVGGVLGVVALRYTSIEAADGARWYTPNPWIGGALSLLLVGRLAWRWGGGAFSQGSSQVAQNVSPLTLGLLAALVAYYVVNGAGLAWRMRELAPAVERSAA